jgi:GntR family transcriptional regulator/MocR family aminotransferase
MEDSGADLHLDLAATRGPYDIVRALQHYIPNRRFPAGTRQPS